jgi:hypothetical protein
MMKTACQKYRQETTPANSRPPVPGVYVDKVTNYMECSLYKDVKKGQPAVEIFLSVE